MLLCRALVAASLALSIAAVEITRARSSPAPHWGRQVLDTVGTTVSNITTTYYFDQLIDHNNPDKGTFKQRYWTSWEFYEPGGPIVLFSPGENSADGFQMFLLNASIMGLLAQEHKGATVLFEHRFFGQSNPYDNLSVDALQVLTLEQATTDAAYFAQNVVLPIPGGDALNAPDGAPWLYFGASYSGSLVPWTMKQVPDVFWAGYASSAVVETILDFWYYFKPIRTHMAHNCSADVESVIAHLTDVFSNGTTEARQAAKDNWGLGGLSHDLDFLNALRNNLIDWQSLQPDSEGGMFLEWCDALEVKNGVNADATGWGLEQAYQAWGAFWNSTYYTYLCGSEGVEDCLGTYNASSEYYTDISVPNTNRAWQWLVCNQVGWLDMGPPAGHPAVVSPLLNITYLERQCGLLFPQQFGDNSLPQPSVAETNNVYGGWDVQIDRIMFVNGHRDPWKYATVSSPLTNRSSTAENPILVGNGYHASDFFTANAAVDNSIAKIQKQTIKQFGEWVREWKAEYGNGT